MYLPPMARLRDVPHVFNSVGIIGFGKRVWTQMSEDSLFTWAAALAYSYLFAIFPFFIFLMSLVPLLPDRFRASAQEQVNESIRTTLPRETATEFSQNLDRILKPSNSGTTFRIAGLLTALWAAAGGMSMTMSALDRCYELPVTGGRPFWKQRLLAIAMTIIVVVLIIAVVVLIPIGTVVKNWVVSRDIPIVQDGPLLILAFDLVRWALALLFMVSVVMVLYHFGPNVKHHFRWITPGSVFTITAWIVLGMIFRFYVDKYGKYDKTYGSVAGVAILLLVFYIDAVVLLIGAEINSEIDFEVLKVDRGTRDFIGAEDEPQQELFAEEPTPAG